MFCGRPGWIDRSSWNSAWQVQLGRLCPKVDAEVMLRQSPLSSCNFFLARCQAVGVSCVARSFNSLCAELPATQGAGPVVIPLGLFTWWQVGA